MRRVWSVRQVIYPVQKTTGLDENAFVSRSGNRFNINGCDFVFAGFNVWQALELSSNMQVRPRVSTE